MKAVAYCDGRGNCPTGACAAVITLDDGRVIEKSKSLGEVTNNIAEYEGVILAMQASYATGAKDLLIYSDSQLIVYQVTGKYQVREDHLREFRNLVWELGKDFSSVEIRWIRREQNKRADELCRRAAEDSEVENPFLKSR